MYIQSVHWGRKCSKNMHQSDTWSNYLHICLRGEQVSGFKGFCFFFFPINVLEKCVWRDGEKHGVLQCSELCVSPQWTVLSVFVNSLSIMYTQVNIKVGRATLYFTDIYIYMMNRLEIWLNVQYSVLLWPFCSTFTAHLEVTLKTSVLMLVCFCNYQPVMKHQHHS